MGNCNCICKGFGVVDEMVKVVTANGAVMELYSPITAQCITNEFPGHAVFRSPHRISPPLMHTDHLSGGNYYYLLPLHRAFVATAAADWSGNVAGTYRMSVDRAGIGIGKRKSSEADVLSSARFKSGGVWKVRLVIDRDRLSEILSEEARTEELVENVRTVVKCATGYSSSAASSDQWSLPSSW